MVLCCNETLKKSKSSRILYSSSNFLKMRLYFMQLKFDYYIICLHIILITFLKVFQKCLADCEIYYKANFFHSDMFSGF